MISRIAATPLLYAIEAQRLKATVLRRREDPERNVGDDTQRPLGAREHLLEVWADRRPRDHRRLHQLAGRQDDGQRDDQVLDAPVARGELPCRAVDTQPPTVERSKDCGE